MAKNPDPSYWGNPPQTPTKTTTPHYSTTPQNPYQPNSQQGYQAPGPIPNQAPQPNAPKPPRKHQGCLIAVIIGIILVFILGIAGCVACTSFIASEEHNSTAIAPHYLEIPDPEYDSNNTYHDNSIDTSLNNEYFRDAFGLPGESSLTTEELNTLQDSFFSDQSKEPNDEGNYHDGVYFVGNDIPAGGYWFSGDDDELSFFFILKPTADNNGYDVTHINNYYGHNLMDLEEGEVLVLINDGTMTPLASMDETFSEPYTSGTYRVGTDIPAGTYQLQLGEADDYSACYVMKDLEFSDSSYLLETYYIEGDQPDEITLQEGTYIELYNMSMTKIVAQPIAQSSYRLLLGFINTATRQ